MPKAAIFHAPSTFLHAHMTRQLSPEIGEKSPKKLVRGEEK